MRSGFTRLSPPENGVAAGTRRRSGNSYARERSPRSVSIGFGDRENCRHQLREVAARLYILGCYPPNDCSRMSRSRGKSDAGSNRNGDSEGADSASAAEKGSGTALFEERREITALFYDLVDSTGLLGRSDLEDYHEVIVSFQRLASLAVSNQGGVVRETMGDGGMAFFGYPGPLEDAAPAAIRAGLGIVDACRKLASNTHRRPTPRPRRGRHVGGHCPASADRCSAGRHRHRAEFSPPACKPWPSRTRSSYRPAPGSSRVATMPTISSARVL